MDVRYTRHAGISEARKILSPWMIRPSMPVPTVCATWSAVGTRPVSTRGSDAPPSTPVPSHVPGTPAAREPPSRGRGSVHHWHCHCFMKTLKSISDHSTKRMNSAELVFKLGTDVEVRLYKGNLNLRSLYVK